jgi:hypothetical protein
MAGETMDYPNLATVPPPPTRATTTAERQKLTQTLVANRTDAEASATGPVPPSTASATPRDLAPCPAPVTASPNPPAPAPPSQPTEVHHRQQGEPPEPQPLESALQMPEVRGVPEPEVPCATLPPPTLPPSPAVAAAPAALPPDTVASAMPAPPPPVPVIADVPPPNNPGRPQTQRPSPGTLAAALVLPGAPPRIDGDARAQIDRVAALYKAEPRTVRVVAYAASGASGAPGGEPLAGYHAALERAQAVAAALQAAGVPADKVQSEAAPSIRPDATDRVEIQLMP